MLIRPDPVARHPYWRARFQDPDFGRKVKVKLDPLALPTAEARRDWAIKKSRTLARRRMELESGAPRATGTGLDLAVGRYFQDHPQLRARTLEIYRGAAEKLKTWASKSGVVSADDLTGPRLVAFRAALIREPKRKHVKGGKRGAVKTTGEPRSASTINVELRATRTILGYLRKAGLLPHITTDDLQDGLERLPIDHERGHYLKPQAIAALLESALAHDSDTFAATREEHAGIGTAGRTARHEAVAPILACAILTGMRAGELVSLTWNQIDLDALGDDGAPVGEIHLSARTKTRRSRTVGLEVSVVLRDLLAAMQPSPATGSVFGLTAGQVKAAVKRLTADYGADDNWSWNALRRTCGTFLTCSPAIFGAAAAYRSARQLGHSVAIAEKHYAGIVRGIPREATTLEAAMGIEDQLQRIVEAAKARAQAD